MSKFDNLCKKTLELSKRYEELSRPHKLSPSAFLRDAMEVAGTTDERLDTLEKALTGPAFVRSNQFYRMAMKFIKEKGCTRPPNELRRLSWLGRLEEVTAELSSIGSSPFELFALAVPTMTRTNPEVFGDIENFILYQESLRTTRDKLENLFKQMERSYGPEDLEIGPTDKEGRARVSIKISKGAVHLGENFPERLVNWLKANQNMKI